MCDEAMDNIELNGKKRVHYAEIDKEKETSR